MTGADKVQTYIFDIRARVDGNDVTVLDPQVVTDDSVDPDTTIIQLIICENDQDGVLSLLASHENGIAAE